MPKSELKRRSYGSEKLEKKNRLLSGSMSRQEMVSRQKMVSRQEMLQKPNKRPKIEFLT